MRDAFGGGFMIRLFLVFVFIYICFTAIALNYAKAFKVKNKVVSYLEDNEIILTDKMTAASVDNMVKEFEKIYGELNYKIDTGTCIKYPSGKTLYKCNGVEITQIGKDLRTGGVYYEVATSVGWNAGFLNKLLAIGDSEADGDEIVGIWKIYGETRLIVKE